MSRLEVRPYSTAIGAEILGVDLARPLSNEDWSVIHEAFHRYLVVFFRDQELSPQAQLELSRRFGELEEYPFVHGIEGYPELIEVVKMPEETVNFGSGWHVDMSFRERPPLGAVLYALEVPPAGGGTMFANMYLAWETLSQGMREMLGRARGVHDSHEPTRHSQRYQGMSLRGKSGTERQLTVHPLVRTHPVTARPSLFISPDYCEQLEDMSVEESRPLLDYLERHATRHELSCRFRWQPGSIAIWDNRCAMHNALEDDLGARLHGRGFKRVMRRATIAA